MASVLFQGFPNVFTAPAVALGEVLTVASFHQPVLLETSQSSTHKVLAVGLAADPGDVLVIACVAPDRCLRPGRFAAGELSDDGAAV
ncbi:Uu.00g007240.m01.CDS01 [Anthostomella pinea]|uniref:Uu.00g007240.m01.CDS01 n=1 Tax=Anthostomella pinea TaxID=933095 RepID=A0AAI8YPU3_9PEZI|nr:Uu.00g007240.m01.CDS01 [Anthostomella pinea]